MPGTTHWPGGVPPVAFVPAVLLVVGVLLVMVTGVNDRYAFSAIFGGFGVGVTVAVLALLLAVPLDDTAHLVRTGIALGTSLSGAAVLLYLVFGCVFGCPG